MKMNKSKIAVAMALTLSATSASAAVMVLTGGGVENVSTVSVAASLKTLGSAADQVGTFDAGGEIGLQTGDVITITAINCKFDRDALDADPVVISKTGGTTAAVEGSWSLDATDTILTATIGATSSTADVTADIITLAGKYDLTGVASTVVPRVDMTVSRSVLGANTVVHKKASNDDALQVFNITDKLQDLATVAAVDGVLQVADSFKKIDGDLIHTITQDKVATAVELDSNAANATGTSLFTLTGLPVSATKVEWNTATGAFSQVISDGSTAPATATAGSTFYLDGAGNGYALLNNAGAKAVFNDSANLVVTVDGESAIPSTKVKLAVDYKAGTSDVFSSHSILSATTVAALTRNGSSFTVNSTGPLNTIKITDDSGALISGTGAIGVVAYDAAGTLVSGSLAVPALASNATVIVSGSDLAAAFPGAIRFDFTVESSSIVASNVKKTSAGTNVTTYSTTGKSL
jgi:hypothetical protein